MLREYEFTTLDDLKHHFDADSTLSSKIDAVIAILLRSEIAWQDQTPQFKAKLCLLLPKKTSAEDIAARLIFEINSVSKLKEICSDVSPELIDEVCHQLMLDTYHIYWEKQDLKFKQNLFLLLRQKPIKSVRTIIQELNKSLNDGRGASNAEIFRRNGIGGYVTLGPSVGTNFLDEFCVLRLLRPIGRKSAGIEIINPMGFESQANFMDLARPYLDNPNVQHIMFPFCNRSESHWYWVTISKTLENKLNIEVFNPTCGSTSSIYKFFDDAFVGSGFQFNRVPFTNSNQLIQPQRDGWSCGYYVSAYAHLKIQQLDSAAECNPLMIDALKRFGNYQYYLRDVCLHVINPGECPMPRDPAHGSSFFVSQPPPQPSKKIMSPEIVSTKKTQDFDLEADLAELFARPIHHETNWNLRGIQQACALTLLMEGMIFGAYFTITALSCLNPAALGAIMIIAAVLVITASNHYESLTL